jgi:predicted dehydrogenase
VTARLASLPHVGFVGVGWIGRHRLEALARSGQARVAAVVDPDPTMREQARLLAPHAPGFSSMEAVLQMAPALDGVVIATPSALHAAQCEQALDRGLAVFCQKPLGRSAAETRAVVGAARRANRLLGVDYCYRHTTALCRVRDLVQSGALGDVYALELTFHNAYGPDKAWFHDRRLSGGGCVMDLGTHLVDAALWLLGFPHLGAVSARLHRGGRLLSPSAPDVEDHAVARLDLQGGTVANLRCSWNLPAGRDAVIAVEAFGTRGGAAFRNVQGSFYDFVAERFVGTRTETLVGPPDAWGGRALTAWAAALREGRRFDERAGGELVRVAEAIDAIYGREGALVDRNVA